MRYYKVYLSSKSRRLLPSRYACHLPPGGRLFVSSIITQIGIENKSSADIYMCIRRGDLRSPAGEHSSPLPCSENVLMRTSIKGGFLRGSLTKDMNVQVCESKLEEVHRLR